MIAAAALPLFAQPPTQVSVANVPQPSPEAGTNAAAAFDRAYRELFDPLLTWYDLDIDLALADKVARMAPPGDPSRMARATAAACLDWRWIGMPDTQARIDSALRQAQRSRDREAVLRLGSCRAAWLENRGQAEQARELASTTLASAERQKLQPRLQLHALLTRLTYASLVGDQAGALIDLDRAQRLFAQAYPGRSSARLDLDRAIAYRRMAAYPDAWDAMQRYQRAMPASSGWQQALRFDNELAYLQQESDRPAAALATSERMIALSRRHGQGDMLASATKIRGEALVALGRHAEALRVLADFDALPAVDKPVTIVGLVQLARAQALAGLGRHAEALAELERSEQQLASSGIQRYLAVIYDKRATSLEALGRSAEALAEYRKHVALRDALQQRMELQRSTFQRMRTQIDAGARENRLLKMQAGLREKQMDALLQARRWQYASLIVGALLLAMIAVLLLRQWQRSRLLRTLATTDQLTGLINRGSMIERMQSTIDAGTHPLSLLLVDIDHFKSINDLHGHPVGDTVLREFARASVEFLDRGCLLGRWGGEEFIVFCRNDLTGGRQLGERIRAGIEALRIDVGGEESLAITVSIGASVLRANETDPLAAIIRADAALYKAKRGGRNRVEGSQ